MRHSFLLLSFLVLLIPGLMAEGPLVVASKVDTEGTLLGKMMVLLLKDRGIPVQDRTGFGTTDIVRKALKAGTIDLYPEYTGNGGFFYPETDPQVWKSASLAWTTVKTLDKDRAGLVWLNPAPANNTWAIAVRQDLARQHRLASLADLARFVHEGGAFKLAGSEEFLSRPDALPAFLKAYGFTLKPNQYITISGGNTALTEKVASLGAEGVNAAMAYGTDGGLAAFGLVVLTDPLGVQPVYQPAPLVGARAWKRYPQLSEILSPLFASLTLETLQSLNGRVQVGGESPVQVAAAYLKGQKLIAP